MGEILKGFDIVLYSGIMGPGGMPGEIVAPLSGEVSTILAQQKVRETWAAYGASPTTMTPERFKAHLRADIAKLGSMVKAAGATID